MSRLGDRLRRHARAAADAHAIHAGDRWWTYRDIAAAAEALALDVGPGDVVAIAMDRGIDAVLAVAAASLAGAIPAPIDPADHELAVRMLARLRPAVVLVGPDDDDLPGARVVEPGRPASPATAPAWDPAPRAAGTAHILFTSGSTADGKAVAWSELRAGYDWMINRPPRAARGRPSGIVAPLCSSLGYHELVRSLYHGASAALLDAPFPAAIAQARELDVDRVKLTPTHVELLLATAEELPQLRVAAVTSAPIAPDRLRALAARLPAARICRSYGLTECGPAAMVWLQRNPNKLHTVGRPVGYRRITVRNEAGRVLPPGRTGEVVVELPMWSKADGYLDAPPELARRFRNGALWTGDRGALDKHGFLVLGSRNAEILKVGGRSVGALRIEEAIAAAGGAAEVAVVGVPDRLLGEVPCAVYVPGQVSAVLEARTFEVRPDEAPRWFLARRQLPRGPSGKVRRGQLAGEAARWTRSFDRAVAPGHRPYPAYALERGVAIVDGCPSAWIGEPDGLDAGARIIALVSPDPPRPLALAIVQAGAAGAEAARFIVGPVAVELADGRAGDDLLDLFAGELVALVDRLPGPRAELTCALAAEPRPFAGAGFIALADPPRWMMRFEAGPGAADGGIEPALRDMAAAADRLAAWARRCADADQRRSAGSPR
jgi:acyl-coenzyme A synthetase/AMP-(fatty) acid ligase